MPAAILAVAGVHWKYACALSVMMFVRSVPTVLLLRTILRRRKEQPLSPVVPLLASAGAFAGALALAVTHLTSWLGPGMTAVHFLRSRWFLSDSAPTWTAKRLGITEACLGAVYILAIGCATNAFLP